MDVGDFFEKKNFFLSNFLAFPPFFLVFPFAWTIPSSSIAFNIYVGFGENFFFFGPNVYREQISVFIADWKFCLNIKAWNRKTRPLS